LEIQDRFVVTEICGVDLDQGHRRTSGGICLDLDYCETRTNWRLGVQARNNRARIGALRALALSKR